MLDSISMMVDKMVDPMEDPYLTKHQREEFFRKHSQRRTVLDMANLDCYDFERHADQTTLHLHSRVDESCIQTLKKYNRLTKMTRTSFMEEYFDTTNYHLVDENIWLRYRNHHLNAWVLRKAIPNPEDGTLELLDITELPTILKLLQAITQTTEVFSRPNEYCTVSIADYKVTRIRDCVNEDVYLDVTELKPNEFYLTCSFQMGKSKEIQSQIDVFKKIAKDQGLYPALSKVAAYLTLHDEQRSKILSLPSENPPLHADWKNSAGVKDANYEYCDDSDSDYPSLIDSDDDCVLNNYCCTSSLQHPTRTKQKTSK
jgi:hypothetical protein